MLSATIASFRSVRGEDAFVDVPKKPVTSDGRQGANLQLAVTVL